MKKRTIIAITTALVLSISALAACGQKQTVPKNDQFPTGGILVVSVNPEVAIEYDEKGIVTKVTARNEDATEIIAACKDLVGKETRFAVTDLISAIGKAGYFTEEIESDSRQITIEIEEGSKLPHDTFLDEVVNDVHNFVNTNGLQVPLEVENESDYGISNYVDTDYGPDNDGAIDYKDSTTTNAVDKKTSTTTVSPKNDGTSNYNHTDYESNNKKPSVSTKPSKNNGSSDYEDTDYGTNNKKPTTPAKPPVNNNGTTDYDKNDNSSNYDDDNGNSNYDDNSSDYDDKSDDGNSNYDD